MAFVSIDNPAGILHHGGQMAWTTISDTRIAMVTFTADYKALIQEINQVGGAPVVGTPSFIAQVPADIQNAAYHLRPKIKNMGNGLVFVIIPNTVVSLSNSDRGWGSIYSYSAGTTARGNLRMPRVYTGYVMERNASGQYSVKSSVQIDTLDITGITANASAHWGLNISAADSTQIVIRRAIQRGSSTPALARNLSFLTLTIPVVDGVLGVPVRATDNHPYLLQYGQYMAASEIKTIKDQQGRDIEIVGTFSNTETNTETSNNHCVWSLPVVDVEGDNCYLLGGGASHATVSKGILNYNNVNAFAMPSIDRKGEYYAMGNIDLSTAVSYNGNYMAQPSAIYNPLDAAWVTSAGVVCVVGGKDTQATPYLTSDNDLAMSIYIAAGGSVAGNATDLVLPLKLSFRLPVMAGQYLGPFDPIQTPYFYKERMNNSRVLHKVDDTHFWLIGCFMADANATPKLGVISVSV